MKIQMADSLGIDIDKQSSQKKKQYFDELYPRITEKGRADFENEENFTKACHLLVRICLSVNDYIHANNILQCFKEDIRRDRPAWYHYHSMLVYGKRFPAYFLEKPDRLEKKIERYLKKGSPETLNKALVNLVMFYVRLQENYPDTFRKELQAFCKHFSRNPLATFPAFNEGVKELQAFLEGKRAYEDVSFDEGPLSPVTGETPTKAETEAPPRDEYRDIVYSRQAKVVVIGDLHIKKNEAQRIAKAHGFDKNRIEFVDYQQAKTFNLGKLRHNENYCGIIFGPIPHSAKGIQGESSLITQVENTEGYPYHVRAQAKGREGNLKITKKSLQNALQEIKNHYETVMV